MLEYPRVALDFMNRDHTDFVALREQLLGLLSTQAHDARVDNLLDELLNHTRHHFAEEERLMQETRFPPYPMHKGEHDSVLAEIAAKIDGWKNTRDAASLRDWLNHRMGDWFVGHVGSMDFVTARFVAAQLQTQEKIAMKNQDIAPQNDPALFDHNKFIQLREKLLDLFDNHAPETAVDAQLDELLQHLRTQFDREEQAMQAVQFPPAAAHKADHDRTYNDFAERIARWKQLRDREAMLDFIEAGLADWFVKHVNTRDYITARFMSEGHS